MLVLPNQLLCLVLSTSDQYFISFQPILCHPHTQMRIILFHDEQRDLPNLEFSPSHPSIGSSQIAFPIIVLPKLENMKNTLADVIGKHWKHQRKQEISLNDVALSVCMSIHQITLRDATLRHVTLHHIQLHADHLSLTLSLFRVWCWLLVVVCCCLVKIFRVLQTNCRESICQRCLIKNEG